MYKRFILLEWKAFFRSASVGKSIGVKILMVFLALYFATLFLFAGIGLYPLIQKYFPGEDPIAVANSYILLWLLAELSLRFFLQTLPVIDIKPLLVLPVRKRKVVNFVLIKSVFSFFNFLPLLLILPFGLFNIYKNEHSTVEIFAWMLAVWGLSLAVNFANFIIKKKFTENLKALLPAVLVVVILGALDYFGILGITGWFGMLLDYILIYPWAAIVPVLLFIGLFFWNQKNLESKFFLDAHLKERTKSANTREFIWTKRFGDIAPYLQQDLKMIWRNKRPKTAVYMSLLLLGYGMIIYPQEMYHDMPAFYVFVGIFITGIFMINFGQFIPAWDASHYPLIMAQNIPVNKYLDAKAGLITFSVVVLAILATPYLYFGWRIFLLNLVCAIYNIGINIPILLYAGSFNRKRIDLDKSPFMNYQGMGAAQWLVGLPLLVLPVLFFWIFYKLISFEIGVAFLLGLGILGLIFRSRAIDFIAQVYKRKKYAMIEGFKQTGE
ncbi:MAG TPA: DUF5687 family protein [Gillisia sp.]|nr:DUF5687 family protein [Gillisia sp.]